MSRNKTIWGTRRSLFGRSHFHHISQIFIISSTQKSTPSGRAVTTSKYEKDKKWDHYACSMHSDTFFILWLAKYLRALYMLKTLPCSIWTHSSNLEGIIGLSWVMAEWTTRHIPNSNSKSWQAPSTSSATCRRVIQCWVNSCSKVQRDSCCFFERTWKNSKKLNDSFREF